MARTRQGLFASLTAKVDGIIVLALALGLGAVFLAFAFSLLSSRDALTRRALQEKADLLYASIENFMLPGEAPIAVRFFGEIELASPGSRVMLFRRNGVKAFSDDTTIERVNAAIGRERFPPRGQPPSTAMPGAELPRFAEAVDVPPSELFFRADEGGRAYFRAYRPLVNLPKCTPCHGSDHTIRGLIDIRTDVTDVARAQTLTIAGAGGGFLAIVAALAFILGSFLRRVVLEPVKSIGALCTEVAGGKFDGRVEVRNRDEIGELAKTVNGMVEGLYERYALTKYVSAGTLGSLRSGQHPTRVSRTLLFSDVRGFTAYTERREPEKVVAVLNRLLEAQSRIIHDAEGDIDKFVGDEVVALFEGENAAARACGAALAIGRLVEGSREEFDGLRLGFGIATGSVIEGMIGSERRADYTVIGDSVNVASRLCSLAKPGQIVACRATREAAGANYSFKGPYAARLKGKEEIQRVWLLEGEVVP